MDIYSPFLFDSFINNEKYWITLFTIYMFTQKSGICAKKNALFEAFPLPPCLR